MSNSVMFRLALEKETHKQLKVKSIEQETTMQAIIEGLVKDWLNNKEQPKKKRVSLMGIAKGGEPITKEDIDEVIQEWNKIESQ